MLQKKLGTYRGRYDIKNKAKYIGNKPPYIRSSWEHRFAKFCDENDRVLKWSSESLIIPYRTPDGENHRYIPDFYVEVLDKNNNLVKYIIEVKPKNQSCKHSEVPKKPNPSCRDQKKWNNYYKKLKVYYVNACKFKACEIFCNSRSIKFLVLTENELV